MSDDFQGYDFNFNINLMLSSITKQKILHMWRCEGKTEEEIARSVGHNLSSVKSVIHHPIPQRITSAVICRVTPPALPVKTMFQGGITDTESTTVLVSKNMAPYFGSTENEADTQLNNAKAKDRRGRKPGSKNKPKGPEELTATQIINKLKEVKKEESFLMSLLESRIKAI